ncbi:MAG TPA: hypothetical protein V6D28_20990 [Leptolyngbyaceae cyanobacterium]
MSPQSERSIRLEVILSSSQPQLLEGLDIWLHLGLLSDAQVKQLCQTYLTCPLPQQVPVAKIPTPTPVAVATKARPARVAEPEAPPSKLKQIWDSLIAELSVRWLLFLGVFMVVVSSGLLAATQWEKFPAFGQYGVLLTYTLIFWGVSFWAGKQRNLQLTAQTLQLVTLFLVPVNFWAMDGFRLWGNPLEWLTVAIASAILTGIILVLLKTHSRRLAYLTPINYLALCYLHWGWGLARFSLVAVYLGIIGTAILLIWRYGMKRKEEGDKTSTSISASSQQSTKTNIGIVVYALTVLLVRAIFTNYVEITQLGLAIAICGWLCVWLSLQRPSPLSFAPPFSQGSWEGIGGVLLLLGWVVSVGSDPSWQAIAVSGLGLWFFANRLQRFWLVIDLTAILAIGLQAIWLFWRAVPSSLREQLFHIAINLTNAQDAPYALLSVALFPYVICVVILSDWLYRRQKIDLAEFTEAIALAFGLILTGVGLFNDLLRSINLLASTITLAIVNQRRPRTNLVYLTHVTGIIAVISAIDYLLPNLHEESWALILLVLMVGEWGFSVFALQIERKRQQENSRSEEGENPLPISSRNTIISLQHWQNSAWYIGLSLAALSYLLFTVDIESDSIWKLAWLTSPVSLTLVASQNETSRKELATKLSIGGLVLAQLLTLHIPDTRLVSLGIATGLMLVNTRYWQNILAAIITIGFGLLLYGFTLWEGIPGFDKFALSNWLLAFAIALNVLWLLRHTLVWRFQRRGVNVDPSPTPPLPGEGLSDSPSPTPLFKGGRGVRFPLTIEQIYAKASDGWAIGLSVFELSLITTHSLVLYFGYAPASVTVLISVIITWLGLAYRTWQQPNNWGIYLLGWGLELFTAEMLGVVGRSLVNLSIANIALGLITQLLGDWWRRRVGTNNFYNSFHVIPVLYGILAAGLRWGFFSNWSGLTTVGIALIAIGVGRRSRKLKPLVFLGLLGISVSAYEILFYQLSLLSGGGLGDGLIAMAALGTSIMYVYRVLSPWLLTYLNISLEELKIVAHLHWAWSSFLLISASLNPIKSSILVGLATGIFLIRYAIFQGRNHPKQSIAEIWIYLGIAEIFAMRLYWMNTPIAQLFADPLVPWRAAIATLPAIFIYLLPWENWGWPKRPWQVAAFVWPLVMILETSLVIHPTALLIVAGFYILLAQFQRQIRFTYLSALLIDWALWRWLSDLRFTNALWYVIPLGLSLLYIAQVDPDLKLPAQKESRHNLRLLAVGTICFVSLWTEQWTGLVSGTIAILVIFAGLALRIRAFLYMGTIAFLINATVQLVILNNIYSFLKWLIGLIVGILFIWIAATFETRREQIITLLRNWINELQNWE